MKLATFAHALALCAVLVPAAAYADDPNDPAMRDPRARARDRAIIRQMNLDQLAHVRARDARYAEGWRAYRENRGGTEGRSDYNRAMADYDRQRANYARERAAWRHAVAACNAGQYEYCQQ